MSVSTTAAASSARHDRRGWIRWAIIIAVTIIVLAVPMVMPEVINQTLARMGVFAVAVLGLNIVMGYTGQVSLGQIFFVGVGAYVTAYGVQNDWNILVTFALAVLIPGLMGLVVSLAAARLGGLAIAMVTIALPIVGVPLAKRLGDLTGGSQGVSARFTDAPEGSIFFDDQWQLYLVIVIGGITFLLARNLVRGKYGRAFAIVKENEAVAVSMGVSPYRYKVLAFTVASLIGGVAGFLYLAVIQYTSPETMNFHHSISLLAAMVIGGSGSIVGSLLGGAYYVLVPQAANEIDANLTSVLQGVLLLVVLFVLPGGLRSLPNVIGRFTRRGGSARPAGGVDSALRGAESPMTSSLHTPSDTNPRTDTRRSDKKRRRP